MSDTETIARLTRKVREAVPKLGALSEEDALAVLSAVLGAVLGGVDAALRSKSLRNASARGHANAYLSFENGRTRGLSDQIKTVLAERRIPMTSHQIADELYQPNPHVDLGTFRRRVIVTASALHKAKPMELEAANMSGRGREKFWVLPQSGDRTGAGAENEISGARHGKMGPCMTKQNTNGDLVVAADDAEA